MRKIFCVFLAAVVLILGGCSKAVTASDMPEIVFMTRTAYNPTVHGFDDESSNQITGSLVFLDKNGNFYFTEDSDIRRLNNDELVERFKAGDERITKLSSSCNTDELLENYKKLLEVSSNKKYELVYPEAMPDVEADSTTWYGLYYDNDGKLSSLPIHESERMTPIEANDDRANEIFEWYRGAAKTQ